MDKEYYEVEIHYKDNTYNTEYKIRYIEDDIIIEYDDATSTIAETLYINSIDGKEVNFDIKNIDEIFLNKICENGECEDSYLFWEADN